jgi:hypothetical protein
MTAQIITLPKRNRNPHVNHPDVQAVIVGIKGSKSTAMPQREVSDRVHLILRIAKEWGVGHLVVAVEQGGVA